MFGFEGTNPKLISYLMSFFCMFIVIIVDIKKVLLYIMDKLKRKTYEKE